MSPIHHVAIFNLFAIALALLGSTIYWIGHPRSRKAEGIIVVSCFTFLGSFTIDIVLTILCRVIHVRYDQYIYRIDARFG